MKTSACTYALFAVMFAWSFSVPARAEDHCKVFHIAKFPVVMDGVRATVPATINGKETHLWLDSGAFFNFMSKARAVELGLKIDPLPPGYELFGIGGSFKAEMTTVHDFGLIGARLPNMQFVVGGSDAGNGFLGANFLGMWDTEFDLANGVVNLFKQTGCGRKSFAYWAQGLSVGEARLLTPERINDHHIYIEMFINGHALRAMLDTGAPLTTVGSHTASRVGIDLHASKTVASSNISGVGLYYRKSWIARTTTISIGGEEIHNSPIRVIDDTYDNKSEDIVLGVDFLMAHHLLVSQSQHKVYLTYNGGPVFSATTDNEIGHIETRAVDIKTEEKPAELKTADEFAGRGSGRLTRNDATGAIADFSEAIRLAPTRNDLLADRATAYLRAGHPDLAAKDIDAALVIAPNDYQMLTLRAQTRLAKGDRTGALADTEAAAVAVPRGSLYVSPVVRLYERLGKANRALGLLDAVVDLHQNDSDYAVLLNERAWVRALANAELDGALKDCNIALRKTGLSVSILDTRALVQLRRKDYPAAIADATTALVKAPKSASTLFFRGLSRIANGDEPGGVIDIAAARAIHPKIDAQYAGYGLVAPNAAKASSAAPAQPSQPDEDDKNDQ